MPNMRCALFWDITRHKVTIPHRSFGTTYRSHLQRPRNQSLLGILDHYLLRNIPEEHRSHLNRGRSPKLLSIWTIMQILVANSPKKFMHNFSRYSWRQRNHWETLEYRPVRGLFISVFYGNRIWGVQPCAEAHLNPLTPNDPYRGRTAPLTSKRCILCIYSTNIGTEYFKHGIYSPFFSLHNAVCFTILTYLVPVLFTFYIQSVLK